VLERAFTIVDRYVHEDPNNQVTRGRLAAAGLGLAAILDNSDAPRALAVYDHILRHMSEIKDNSSARRFEVSALAGSTYPLRQLGRPAEAQQRLGLAFERLRQLKAYPAEKIKPSSEAAVTLRAMADLEASTGNAGKAIEIYESLLDRILASGSNSETNLMDATELSRIYAALTTLNRRAAHVDLASAWEVRRLQLWQRWDRKLPHNVFVSEQLGTVNPPSNEWLLSKR